MSRASIESKNELLITVDLTYLQCPITTEVCNNATAVITPEGHSFTEYAIKEWLKKKRTSPVTQSLLEEKELRPNLLVRKILQNAQMTKHLGDGGKWVNCLTINALDLINPRTKNFYKNPWVDRNGNSVDEDERQQKEIYYPNLMIRNVIELLLKSINEDQEYVDQKDIKDVKDQISPVQIEMKEALIRNPREAELNYQAPAEVAQLQQRAAGGRILILQSPNDEAMMNEELINAREIYRIYRRRFNCLASCLGIFIGCSLVTGGSLIYLLVIYPSSSKPDDNCIEPNKPLTYAFDIPWEKAGKFCLSNNQASPYQVGQIQFTNSVHIKDSVGDKQYIWGDLFPGGSTLNTQYKAGTGYTHLITLPTAGVTIAPNAKSCLTFEYDRIDGPLPNVGNIAPGKYTDVWADGKKLPVDGLCWCCKNPAPDYDLSGFFNNWGIYQRKYTPKDIPIDALNHIRGPMLLPDPQTGNLISSDAYADGQTLPLLSLLKAQRPYLVNTFTIGGYCTGEKFNSIVSDPGKLANFTQDAAVAIKKFNYDGITLDWEWWGDEQCKSSINGDQLAELVSHLRQELGADARIDLALPALKIPMQQISEANWCQIFSQTNTKMLMTYDFNGYPWSGIANYNSPLFVEPSDPTYGKFPDNLLSVDGAQQVYSNLTCYKSDEFAIGIPAYARVVNVTNTDANFYGLWKTMTGVPKGQFDLSNQPNTGFFDYRCINGLANSNSKECLGGNLLPNDIQFIPTENNRLGAIAKQPWAYSQSQKLTVSYDDAQAAQAKACYVIEQQMKGIMVWDLAQDAPINNNGSLVKNAQSIFQQKGIHCKNKIANQYAATTISTPSISELCINSALQATLSTLSLKLAESLVQNTVNKKISDSHQIYLHFIVRLCILSYFNGISGAMTALLIPFLKQTACVEKIGVSKDKSDKLISIIEAFTLGVSSANHLYNLINMPILYTALISSSAIASSASAMIINYLLNNHISKLLGGTKQMAHQYLLSKPTNLTESPHKSSELALQI